MKISVSIQPDNRLTITVGDGGVMLYQCPLGQEHIELKAVLPADSSSSIKSDGTVHVEAEKELRNASNLSELKTVWERIYRLANEQERNVLTMVKDEVKQILSQAEKE